MDMDKIFEAIEWEASQGAEDRLERLAQTNGYMRALLRQACVKGFLPELRGVVQRYEHAKNA